MKQDSKKSADQEAITQALEQLQHSMEMIQQIVRRLHRSVTQAQANIIKEQHEEQASSGSHKNSTQKSSLFQQQGGHERNDQRDKLDRLLMDESPKVLH